MKKLLKKVFLPIFLSVICGSICGKLIYDIYDKDLSKELEGEKIYLLQAGAYSNYDNMVKNTLVNNYIYYEDYDGLYKAIIGITEKYTNIEKIKKIYGKEIIISEYYSKNKELNKKIKEYDKKISKSENAEEIQNNVLEMLTLYKDNDDKTLVKITT
ncbi:MAG: hypothetical protein IJI49_05575 [Bacilli bacterium]|nr:hypothetical protein [Bacilli bacterium]